MDDLMHILFFIYKLPTRNPNRGVIRSLSKYEGRPLRHILRQAQDENAH